MNWFKPSRKTRSTPPSPNAVGLSEALSNFTPRAQQVLALAREEAGRFKHNFVGTEHLLLGLIRLGQGCAFTVLGKMGVDLETVRLEVEHQVGIGPDEPDVGRIPYTPRVKKALALADKERKAFKHTYLGTEHILLGLLREGDGVAARVLKNLEVDIEVTRQLVLKELDPNYSSPSTATVIPQKPEIMMPRGIASINPLNGQVLRRYEPHSEVEVEHKLRRATEAFREYRRMQLMERARLMVRAAEILESGKNDFARTITLEMGKLLRAAVQEVEKCALGCRYYAEHASGFLADEPANTPGTRSFVRYQPLGPVLAVMPWNFPFWQVFRFAAPALMAGNVGFLKHASNVPQSALAIEEVFRRAGFPEGVFQSLLIGSDRVSALIADERVKAVTLTGSVGAGQSVAAAAGKQIKKTVLELGGSDPFIVMPSANLDQAVSTAVQARTINNGQSCIAAKRFLVDRRIADEFERRFVDRMASLKVGDPMNEATDVGPLATDEVRALLEQQVSKTVKMGARVLLGGKRIDGPGYFFQPTVLTDIPKDSPAYQEELFGPVASLFRANGIEEAIQIANDTNFGLGACAWTDDERERELFVNEIEAGVAFVNGMVASDPRLPFGGIKQSGYGRELSRDGIREFVNIKTVSVYEVSKNRSETE